MVQSRGEAGEIDEILIESRAVWGVVHLGVELDGEEPAGRIGGDRKGRVGRGAVDVKARRKLRYIVPMAHPDLFVAIGKPALKQRQIGSRRADEGAAKLGSAVTRVDLTAKLGHHHLLAVADAKNGNAEIKHRLGCARAVRVKHAGRSARQDHGPGSEVAQEFVGNVLKRVNFAVDANLAQAAGDKLRHLACRNR